MMHQVTRVDRGLAAGAEDNRRVICRVAGRREEAQPGNDVVLAFDQLQLSRLVQRDEVLRKIGPFRPVVRMAGHIVFAGLDVVPGIRERWYHLPIAHHRIPATVVGVKVRVRNRRDLFWPHTCLSQRLQKVAVVARENLLSHSWAMLVAHARFDHHHVVAPADHHAIELLAHAMFGIDVFDAHLAFPHHPRDKAEDRAPVHPDFAVGNYRDLKLPNPVTPHPLHRADDTACLIAGKAVELPRRRSTSGNGGPPPGTAVYLR